MLQLRMLWMWQGLRAKWTTCDELTSVISTCEREKQLATVALPLSSKSKSSSEYFSAPYARKTVSSVKNSGKQVTWNDDNTDRMKWHFSCWKNQRWWEVKHPSSHLTSELTEIFHVWWTQKRAVASKTLPASRGNTNNVHVFKIWSCEANYFGKELILPCSLVSFILRKPND